jgi:peptidyl-prolyl cis-trans isomerase C
MNIWQKTASVLAIAAVLAQPSLAQDATSAETVVATINGTDITVGHLILAYDTLPDNYKSLTTDQLFEGLLEQMVQQTLLSQTAKNPDLPAVRYAIENEKRLMLAGVAVNELSDSTVTDDALRARYADTYGAEGADLGVEYSAAHILLETEEAAKDILDQLANGADFAELAKSKSTGPSGPNGGELGWFGAGMMVAEFENAVKAMEVGAVSAPVQTQFGWHVIKLNDTRPVKAPEFESVKGELASEMQREVVEGRIRELQDSATITKADLTKIDSAVIKDVSLLEK